MVTVVILVWGKEYEKYLDRCLKSVELQNSPDLKILLMLGNQIEVDSKNYTLDIRIIPLEKPDSLGQARNQSIEEIHTELVMYLDVDDQLLPLSIERLLQSSKREDAVVTGRTVSEFKDKFYRPLWPPDYFYLFFSSRYQRVYA